MEVMLWRQVILKSGFWCGNRKDAITKLSFTTEEIHFLAKEKKEAEKNAKKQKLNESEN